MKTKIIYEDAQLIVCQKPAGLAVQSGKIGELDVVSELKNKNKSSYLGIVHRLDQPVEGLLVFAKTKQAAANLTLQLNKGTLNKAYYGVTCEKVITQQAELVNYIRKDKVSNKAEVIEVISKQACIPCDAKQAILQYQVIEQVSIPEPLTLLKIHIDTGRFHQIRVQLSYAGLALLGDRKYANNFIQETSMRLGIKNVALCAYQIEFLHPISGKKLCYNIRPEGAAFSYFLKI